MERETCRHCHERPVNRGRGLCWVCGNDPAIRNLYGPVSAYGNRGPNANGRRASDVLPVPTDAEPGSERKKIVLEERARNRQELHVARDERRIMYPVTTRCPRVWLPRAIIEELESEGAEYGDE